MKLLLLSIRFSLCCTALTCLSQQTRSSPGLIPKALSDTISPVHSISLRGRVVIHRGDHTESGTTTLFADDAGTVAVHFELPSGTQVEDQWESGNRHFCKRGSGEKVSEVLTPNCWLAVPWFFPQMALATERALHVDVESSTNKAQRSREQAVSVARHDSPRTSKPEAAADLKRFSKLDLNIDQDTTLPTSATYIVRSERGIPAEANVTVMFAEYKAFSGLQVATHIQRLFNGALQADIQIESVEIK